MRRALMALVLLVSACKSLSREELYDPANCADCHPSHFEQWSGSMHAYAAEDPVFLAMNAKGQEETGGELGSLCISCHAPLAVELGLTDDGLNLDGVPAHLRGVTCAFCHLATDVHGDANNPVDLAKTGDLRMRGAIADPTDNPAHRSAYSDLHDRDGMRSSDLCGSCHDIVLPNGVHLERTFAEWRETIFAQPGSQALSCGGCHMRGQDGVVADFEGVPLRRVHSHTFAGVDLAITEFPNRDAQRAEVQALLDSAVLARLCANPIAGGAEIVVRLENVASGHDLPSGAAQDRRFWVELRAWDGDDLLLETGVVPDEEAVVDAAGEDGWILRDTLFDAAGSETHDFWEVASIENDLLQATRDVLVPHFRERSWQVFGALPDRIEMLVRARPMDRDVLGPLVDEGWLDAEFLDTIETFDLAATRLVWTGPVGTCVGG